MQAAKPDLSPRKSPRQARAAATVDAIFEATIQVLLSDDITGLTTTRVAARAGVSVGTLYQYYPHKQALLYAALQRNLDTLVETIEATCVALHGQALAPMADALAIAWLRAKTDRPDVTRALYRITAELGTAALGQSVFRRLVHAVRTMLDSAPDAAFADSAMVAATLLASLTGTVRAVFDYAPDMAFTGPVETHVALMCRAYLHAARQPATMETTP